MFMNMLKIALLCFCAQSFSCSEDTVSPEITGDISGEVTDNLSGSPISGASITTTPPTSAIVTDSGGKFKIEELAPGNYAIIIEKTEYSKKTVTVAVQEAKTTQAFITLNKIETENTSPNQPSNPIPASGAIDQPIRIELSWQSGDPDPGDQVLYDVLLFTPELMNGTLVGENLADTTLSLNDLDYNTTYFWQVIAKDTSGLTTNSEIWSFLTMHFPDNPIVFASDMTGNFEIFSAGITDSLITNPLQLTETANRNWWPRLNRRNNKIAFVADRNAGPQIFTMNRDGTAIFRVTTLPIAGFHNFGIGFCWSPDGTHLLYSHYNKLYRINFDGSNNTLIATAPVERHFREVEWSPVGEKIAVVTAGSQSFENEILLMETDGSNALVFVENVPGTIANPVFSIDGKQLMFTHDISAHEVATGRQLDSHIFIWHIDGSDSTDVSIQKPDGTNDFYPRFSPTGAQIIFANVPNDDSAPPRIYVMDRDGSNRKAIIGNGIMADWQ
ncbi:MAG: hypothetical protein DWQ05_21295 [Calditrichaeota bacterium]|nr:MAG: hypothetical protein DWQ05_21295 [Calditrichota bacterium]